MPATAERPTPPSAAADVSGWQAEFDYLVPNKATFRADEVAAILNCDVSTVERLYDAGKLNGHDINAGTGARKHIRYHRNSLVIFLAERASFHPDDEVMRIFEIVMKRPHATAQRFYALVGNALRRKAGQAN
jgi:hypothetical protein